MAPTSMGLAVALGLYDVALPLSLILKNTIRDVVGLTTVPQQQPQSQIPSQAYAKYAMGIPKGTSFFSRVESPTDFLMFMHIMVFAFCLKVPMWLQCSPMGAPSLDFAPLQPLREYCLQAHISL